MTIRYFPEDMLKKLAPKKKIERLLTDKLTVNRTALSMVDSADFIDKKKISSVALKVAKKYRQRYKDERKDGASKGEAMETAINDKKLLVQRVQNAIVWQVSQEIREQYSGEKYRWLPSSAEHPRDEHQLNYGKVFTIGDGEQPGDKDGCQCGMEILVKDKELKL